MKSGKTVTCVRKVFAGGFLPVEIPMRKEGRACDGFVYFLSGGAEYRFAEGGSFCATPRGFIYLQRGARYAISVREKSEFICADFDFSDMPSGESGVYERVPPTVRNDFMRLLSTARGSDGAAQAQLYAILYELYAMALASERKSYYQHHSLFAGICEDIAAHYTDPSLSIADVAARAGISEVHLRRIFHRELDTSPVRYLLYLRMEHAKNLLTDSNYRIEEVALASGFSDPYYFSRTFRRSVGMPPGAYRREHA